MIRFHLKRGFSDYAAHIILITLPILIGQVMSLVYKNLLIEQGEEVYSNFILYTTIGFVLVFQIYGSSFSFKVIGEDLFTDKKDRLKSAPVDLRNLVLSNLISSIIINSLQSMIVITITNFMIKGGIEKLYFIIPVMLLSVLFHQLFGTFILLIVKSIKNAQMITIMYGILAPVLMGLYFQLPKGAFFDGVKKYATPLSLMNNSIMGIINNNTFDIFLGIFVIMGLIAVMIISMKPLIKEATK